MQELFKNNYSQEINIFSTFIQLCSYMPYCCKSSYVSDTCILNCTARISNSIVRKSFQNMKAFYCKGNLQNGFTY